MRQCIMMVAIVNVGRKVETLNKTQRLVNGVAPKNSQKKRSPVCSGAVPSCSVQLYRLWVKNVQLHGICKLMKMNGINKIVIAARTMTHEVKENLAGTYYSTTKDRLILCFEIVIE